MRQEGIKDLTDRETFFNLPAHNDLVWIDDSSRRELPQHTSVF